MKEKRECQHEHQEETGLEFDDDGMYRRFKCLKCGDEITEYYELVNVYNYTKGIEMDVPGREKESQKYMLLGCHCDDNRPNIEVVYIDEDVNKVIEAMRLIERINEESDEAIKKKLALKAKKLGIAIIDDYEQVDDIGKLEIISPVKVTVHGYENTKR